MLQTTIRNGNIFLMYNELFEVLLLTGSDMYINSPLYKGRVEYQTVEHTRLTYSLLIRSGKFVEI